MWVILGVTIAFWLIGFYDDYLKLVVGIRRGLPRAGNTRAVAGRTGRCVTLWFTAQTPAETTLYLPILKDFALPLGAAGFIGLTYLMIVGMSNAVNLTDGLDGLAIMPAAMGRRAGIFAWPATT